MSVAEKGGTQTECGIIDNGLQKLKMKLDVRVSVERIIKCKGKFFF